eukprot:10865763-Alexandrium_andersonii.AAC.1
MAVAARCTMQQRRGRRVTARKRSGGAGMIGTMVAIGCVSCARGAGAGHSAMHTISVRVRAG